MRIVQEKVLDFIVKWANVGDKFECEGKYLDVLIFEREFITYLRTKLKR